MKKYLRLYWGENYADKPKHIQALINSVALKSAGLLNLYPGEIYQQTIDLLAKHLHLSTKEILLGNGVDGFLNLIGKCFIKEKIIGILSPSYSIYEKVVSLYKGAAVKIGVKIGQKFTVHQIAKQIENTKLFFLAYPNNPTGQYIITPKQMEKLLQIYKGILVVDECYFGIGEYTVVNLVNKYHNLIVLRSFSKSMGLAGLRFGFAVSAKKNIELMEKYSLDIEIDQINIFAHLLAQAVILHETELFTAYKQFKQDFIDLLEKEIKVKVIPTNTSYILFEVKNQTNSIIAKKLAKFGIYIKDTIIYPNFPQNLLMFAIPEKKYWDYFIACFKEDYKSLKSLNVSY